MNRRPQRSRLTMTTTTHQRAGLVFGVVTQQYLIAHLYSHANAASQLFIITLYCTATIIGSPLPDIDLKNSQIGSLFPVTSTFISTHFKHRTLTHSLLSIFLFLLLLSYAPYLNIGQDFYTLLITGLLVGHSSHIFLDLLTTQGVCLFYPWKKKIRIANFKTGAKGEGVINGILFLTLFTYLLIKLSPYYE